ncbi:MAG: hypothetical protein EA407_13745 [Rhodobacteraceae bacterium]|nr:MAG: hypothetical protein EA407_13745 [Paracoccaceae bacterium]
MRYSLDTADHDTLAPEALQQLGARADAPVFWPLRLQNRLALPGLAGGIVAVAFLLLAWAAAGGGHIAALPTAQVGEALFFALSLGLIVELAALIPRAAQGDLDALSTELTLDPTHIERLKASLIRYQTGDVAVNATIGLAIGVLHVALLGSGWAAVSGDPLSFVLALGTVALWAMMVQTGTLFVANARLFAHLGRSGVRVEILMLDRLRPFASAALRPMLLVMVLLAAYPLMLLGTAAGLEASAAIGPVATALLALAVVWLPLRGLRARIREARAQQIKRIDAAIAEALQAVDKHGVPDEPQRLEALIALRNRVQAAPALPVGLGGIGRGLLYLALPVVTWGGKGFAEALLNWLF